MNANVIELNKRQHVNQRILKAKAAFTTRRVNLKAAVTLVRKDATPQAGDLVLARVDRIGQHQRIELVNGRRARMLVGDEIVVAYGNRQAPDQFEAIVPDSLAPCHLAAAGGVAAGLVFKHEAVKNPTALSPIGLLGDSRGKVLNLADFALEKNHSAGEKPMTIAVAGTAMNAGKTTTVTSLIRGLSEAGFTVGAAKVTGTGAGGDLWFMKDAGARKVLDFTDAGYPSTYRVPFHEIEQIVVSLTAHLSRVGVDVIVLEVADGLYQEETAKLLSAEIFRHLVDGVK